MSYVANGLWWMMGFFFFFFLIWWWLVVEWILWLLGYGG